MRRNFGQKGQRYEQKTHRNLEGYPLASNPCTYWPSVHAILNCTPFAMFDSPRWRNMDEKMEMMVVATKDVS